MGAWKHGVNWFVTQDVTASHITRVTQRESDTETEANAKLMAATPDMLKVLSDIVDGGHLRRGTTIEKAVIAVITKASGD